MRHKNDISSIHQGFVVVCIDNRGSLHRGAGWEAYLKGRSPNKKPENHENAWKSENKAKHISFLLAGWARSSSPTRWRFSTGLPLSLATSTSPGVKVEQQDTSPLHGTQWPRQSQGWYPRLVVRRLPQSDGARTISRWVQGMNHAINNKLGKSNIHQNWILIFLIMKGKIRKYNQIKLI